MNYFDKNLNVKFDEFYKLKFKLQEADIPFEDCSYFDTVIGPWMQLCYPSKDRCRSDVVFHKNSYGYDRGLLEMLGLTGPDVGVFTADEVFDIWKKNATRSGFIKKEEDSNE